MYHCRDLQTGQVVQQRSLGSSFSQKAVDEWLCLLDDENPSACSTLTLLGASVLSTAKHKPVCCHTQLRSYCGGPSRQSERSSVCWWLWDFHLSRRAGESADGGMEVERCQICTPCTCVLLCVRRLLQERKPNGIRLDCGHSCMHQQ